MKIEYSFLISFNKATFKDEDAKEFLETLSPQLKTTFLIVNKSNSKVKILVMSNLIEYIKEAEQQKNENTNNGMGIKLQNKEKEIMELKQKLEMMSKCNEASNAKSKEMDAFMDQIKVLNDRMIELDNEKTKAENEVKFLNLTLKNMKDTISFGSERRTSLSILKQNPKLLSDNTTNYDDILSNYDGTFGSEYSDETRREEMIKKEQEYKESLSKKEEIINSFKEENLKLKQNIEEEIKKNRSNDVIICEAKVIKDKILNDENLLLENSKLVLKNLHLINVTIKRKKICSKKVSLIC